MRSMLLFAATTIAAALPLASCGPPVMNTPVNDIPKLATLAEVMDNQATTADPQFKKIGEEATETVMAAKDGDKIRVVGEVADLWFHCLVLLARHGLGPADVVDELARREGISGHVERASRI